MRRSRIPLFRVLFINLSESELKRSQGRSRDLAARNLLTHKGSKRKVLAFMKRSGAKAGLVLAKRNKGGRERKRSGKTG